GREGGEDRSVAGGRAGAGSPESPISAEDPRIIRSLEAALHLLRSSALAVRTVSGTIAVGKPIDEQALADVLNHLDRIDVGNCFDTDRLASLGAPAEALARDFAGMMAARITRDGEWLVVLRPEQVEEVTWGSAKDKKIVIRDGAPRLSPEGSFGLWRETVRGRSRE